MPEFEIIKEKHFTIGQAYLVHTPGSKDVIYTVKRKVWTLTPKLTMIAGADGPTVAMMTVNYSRLRFTMTDAQGTRQATLTFPFFSLFLKRCFSLEIGGKTFEGPLGLRDHLLSKREAFVTALARKLLTYALGRGFREADEPATVALVRSLAPDYRFSELIQGLARLDAFQRRGRLR